MGGIAWPFNSSNTALESAAVTSKAISAEKWRVSPARISASRITLPSARTRTRVTEEVETERSKASGGWPETNDAACAEGLVWAETADDCLARR